MTTRYWIISGGDCDSCWEVAARAKSAEEALKKFQKHNLDLYNEDIKRIKEKYPDSKVYRHITTQVTVVPAKFDKFGVLMCLSEGTYLEGMA